MSRHCVLHIIATNFFGGPEKQIVHHCASMDSKQWRMVVCSFSEGKLRNELLQRSTEQGLETSVLRTAVAYNPLVICELDKLIRQQKPDIIVAHGYRPLILCLLLKPFHQKPIVSYSRGYTEENFKIRLFEKCHRLALRFSNIIVAVSDGHKQVLISYGLAKNKITVVHNAVSTGEPPNTKPEELRKVVCEKFDIPKSSKMVATAGRLSPEKGHRYLVEAIKEMGEKSNNTFFIFCGEGKCQKNLEKQAQNLGIYDKCRFPGFCRDLREIFHAMDLMVLPSLTEGLPNVILEAFACSKPVVATAVGGVPEIVEDGINGILVPAKRSDLLAVAINKCLLSPKRSQQMGEAGYDKVKSQFTFGSQTKKLENIYHEVLQ